MLNTPIGRLRIISILEAISFIYLCYCSIYLKRMMGDDTAIRIPGMIHGLLFCIYCPVLFQAMEKAGWTLKTTSLIFLSSLVPIAPFFIESWLKKEDHRACPRTH